MNLHLLHGSIVFAALAWGATAAAISLTATRWTPSAIATDQYESSPTFSPDGRELYFMRADPNFDNYRILWSRCGSTGWTPPVEVPFAGPPGVLEADPFVTVDGRTLYYVSTRADPRRENLDIWAVDRMTDGQWAPSRRLPAPVNSERSEMLPRLTPTGDLYFGSSRAGGHGQGDIYRARTDGAGRWRVENVGPPISTPANEFEAEVSRDGRQMVVVADRGTRSHLYRFRSVNGRWVETGQVPATDAVFQVGPHFSPTADRLLFAERHGRQSGEIFLLDLESNPRREWPPRCDGSK